MLPLAPLLVACLLAAEPADRWAGLAWRNVGPFNMSGRVADVEGVPGDPAVVWVGAASGGVWKSVNGGTTFAPVFDEPEVASIGDLALAPSNPSVVYVGTGEANVRNSVGFGRGVWKSTDAGATWTHVGLGGTRHISRVVVHPTDPDTVWVGALGSIWGPSEERGVYKTTDGGESWERVLFLSDRHGVADLDLDPRNPNVVFAAMWRFERKPWTHRSGGEEGGVFRSVDGGASWKKVEDGLPRLLGRVGVKVAPSDPRVVYVIAESNEGTMFRSDDHGASFRKVSDDLDIIQRGFYYTDLRVDPTDANTVFAVASALSRSIDGGKTFDRIGRATHIDHHSLWIDPEDPRRIWQGQDGGVAVSYDRGERWDPIRNLPIGQFYQAFVTAHEGPFYRVGGGMQDNGTWIGPSRSRQSGGIWPDEWWMFSFGDAYWVVNHPEDPDLFLSEWQGGGIVRTDLGNARQVDVSPQPRRNDGGPVGELEVRFNWNSPIVASPHDPNVVYFTGNVVFRSDDFGDSWTAISGDLTTNDPAKLGEAGGPVWTENTVAEYHCTIISFGESPVAAGVLWAGSDDGRLHVSRNGGRAWTDVTANVDVPAFSPVSHVEPSRTAEGAAYVSFDRHMFDDLRPHVFRTVDFGATWERISTGLPPQAWVWVVREDPKNPDVLYAGTELGLFCSWDRGRTWEELDLANLPTVAVHDVIVHPTENDLVLGTHGRALWILDDATPVQQWSEELARVEAHLFPVRRATRHATTMGRYGVGDRVRAGGNPEYGALVTYVVGEGSKESNERKEGEEKEEGGEGRVRIEILGAAEVLRTMRDLPATAGVHRVAWDLRVDSPMSRKPEGDEGDEFDEPAAGPQVGPGVYTVRLVIDDGARVLETPVEVVVDPALEARTEDLLVLYRAGRLLAGRIDAVHRRLRSIDDVGAQVAERKASWKRRKDDVPDELDDAWRRFEEGRIESLQRLTRPEEKPVWSVGPRVAERLRSLMGSLERQFERPTAAQAEYLEELSGEAEAAVEAADALLNDGVEALNRVHARYGVPPIATSPVTPEG